MSRIHRLAITVSLALAALIAVSPGALAQEQQQLEIKGKPPEERVTPLEVLPPPGAREITRPRESDFYPDNIRVRFDPAFIPPLAAVRQTGPRSAVQFGFAGWTSPHAPVGLSRWFYREDPGAFALGFAIVWDVNVPQGGGPAPSGSPR